MFVILKYLLVWKFCIVLYCIESWWRIFFIWWCVV